MTIRFATAGDAPRLAAIYEPYVQDTAITFLYTPTSADAFAKKIAEHEGVLPFLVCETEGVVEGYAYASPWRYGDAYGWDVELSVYVRMGMHGHGIGKALYGIVLRLLAIQGYVNAYSGVTLPNEKSMALHNGFGFTQIGIFPGTGYKCGAWHDVIWLGKRINETTENPAAPVRLSGLEQECIRAAFSAL